MRLLEGPPAGADLCDAVAGTATATELFSGPFVATASGLMLSGLVGLQSSGQSSFRRLALGTAFALVVAITWAGAIAWAGTGDASSMKATDSGRVAVGSEPDKYGDGV